MELNCWLSAPFLRSCRSGTVVFLVGATNQQVPVRIKLAQREEPSGLVSGEAPDLTV